MKKKTLILTGLCALGLFTWEVQAFSPKQVLLTMVMIIKNFVGNCSLQFPLSL